MNLPLEIIHYIFDYLPVQDYSSLCLVSKQFHQDTLCYSWQKRSNKHAIYHEDLSYLHSASFSLIKLSLKLNKAKSFWWLEERLDISTDTLLQLALEVPNYSIADAIFIKYYSLINFKQVLYYFCETGNPKASQWLVERVWIDHDYDEETLAHAWVGGHWAVMRRLTIKHGVRFRFLSFLSYCWSSEWTNLNSLVWLALFPDEWFLSFLRLVSSTGKE